MVNPVINFLATPLVDALPKFVITEARDGFSDYFAQQPYSEVFTPFSGFNCGKLADDAYFLACLIRAGYLSYDQIQSYATQFNHTKWTTDLLNQDLSTIASISATNFTPVQIEQILDYYNQQAQQNYRTNATFYRQCQQLMQASSDHKDANLNCEIGDLALQQLQQQIALLQRQQPQSYQQLLLKQAELINRFYTIFSKLQEELGEVVLGRLSYFFDIVGFIANDYTLLPNSAVINSSVAHYLFYQNIYDNSYTPQQWVLVADQSLCLAPDWQFRLEKLLVAIKTQVEQLPDERRNLSLITLVNKFQNSIGFNQWGDRKEVTALSYNPEATIPIHLTSSFPWGHAQEIYCRTEKPTDLERQQYQDLYFLNTLSFSGYSFYLFKKAGLQKPNFPVSNIVDAFHISFQLSDSNFANLHPSLGATAYFSDFMYLKDEAINDIHITRCHAPNFQWGGNNVMNCGFDYVSNYKQYVLINSPSLEAQTHLTTLTNLVQLNNATDQDNSSQNNSSELNNVTCQSNNCFAQPCEPLQQQQLQVIPRGDTSKAFTVPVNQQITAGEFLHSYSYDSVAINTTLTQQALKAKVARQPLLPVHYDVFQELDIRYRLRDDSYLDTLEEFLQHWEQMNGYRDADNNILCRVSDSDIATTQQLLQSVNNLACSITPDDQVGSLLPAKLAQANASDNTGNANRTDDATNAIIAGNSKAQKSQREPLRKQFYTDELPLSEKTRNFFEQRLHYPSFVRAFNEIEHLQAQFTDFECTTINYPLSLVELDNYSQRNINGWAWQGVSFSATADNYYIHDTLVGLPDYHNYRDWLPSISKENGSFNPFRGISGVIRPQTVAFKHNENLLTGNLTPQLQQRLVSNVNGYHNSCGNLLEKFYRQDYTGNFITYSARSNYYQYPLDSSDYRDGYYQELVNLFATIINDDAIHPSDYVIISQANVIWRDEWYNLFNRLMDYQHLVRACEAPIDFNLYCFGYGQLPNRIEYTTEKLLNALPFEFSNLNTKALPQITHVDFYYGRANPLFNQCMGLQLVLASPRETTDLRYELHKVPAFAVRRSALIAEFTAANDPNSPFLYHKLLCWLYGDVSHYQFNQLGGLRTALTLAPLVQFSPVWEMA